MNEAEHSRLAREQEIKRLKAQLALFEMIQYDGHIIYWKNIPEPLHDYMCQRLYGAAVPGGGVWAWDVKRAEHSLIRELQRVMIPGVIEEPIVVLYDWNIYEFQYDLILVGVHDATGRGRRTSPVVQFDLQNMQATTHSGRRYFLTGCPVRLERFEDMMLAKTWREIGAITSWA